MGLFVAKPGRVDNINGIYVPARGAKMRDGHEESIFDVQKNRQTAKKAIGDENLKLFFRCFELALCHYRNGRGKEKQGHGRERDVRGQDLEKGITVRSNAANPGARVKHSALLFFVRHYACIADGLLRIPFTGRRLGVMSLFRSVPYVGPSACAILSLLMYSSLSYWLGIPFWLWLDAMASIFKAFVISFFLPSVGALYTAKLRPDTTACRMIEDWLELVTAVEHPRSERESANIFGCDSMAFPEQFKHKILTNRCC